MQNPAAEISDVVQLLTAAHSPDIQKATVYRYLTSDAAFQHPLCSVSPGMNSRESVLGIYQWYRVLSPHIDITVDTVTYDKVNKILLLDISQLFHIRHSPFKVAPARLLVRISLREQNGLYYISKQEDFYHPTDLVSLVLPPLVPLVKMGLAGAAFVSNINARLCQVVGIWRPVYGGVKNN